MPVVVVVAEILLYMYMHFCCNVLSSALTIAAGFLSKVIVWFVQLIDSEEYLPGQLLIVRVCKHFMSCYICSQKHSLMLIFKKSCHVCTRY